jgi:hypothetical protein
VLYLCNFKNCLKKIVKEAKIRPNWSPGSRCRTAWSLAPATMPGNAAKIPNSSGLARSLECSLYVYE